MKISAVLLAAGKGTRMRSAKAKVLHNVFFSPMIQHVFDTVKDVTLDKIIVVVGHQGERVQRELVTSGEVVFVHQAEQLGTGHAVLVTEEEVQRDGPGVVVILCGDCPLIRRHTLIEMIQLHQDSSSCLTVMTTQMEDPTNYGRIVSFDNQTVDRIVEEKDASEEERAITEINAGIYCVDSSFLFSALKKVGTDNEQGEVYLTDIVQIATDSGFSVTKYVCPDPFEVLGVNSRVELEQAGAILRGRRNRELMENGVSILDSQTTFIEKGVQFGVDITVHPHVHLSGQTVIGDNVEILPFCHIHNSNIEPDTTVDSFSHIINQ